MKRRLVTPDSPLSQVTHQRVAADRIAARCKICGATWIVQGQPLATSPAGRVMYRWPVRWWVCPQGCNAKPPKGKHD